MSARAPGVAPAAFLAEKRLKIRDGEDESVKTMKGPATVTWRSSPATRRHSTRGTRSRSGPPGLATSACRCRPGTARLIDLKKAASSQDYCDEFVGVARANGVEVTELSIHLQGQLIAVHPTYDAMFDGFAAPEVRGNPKARQKWADEQVRIRDPGVPNAWA